MSATGMKVCILSRNPQCYSTRRIREAATQRGHSVKVLDTLKFTLQVERERPRLFFRSRRLSHYDAVIPRIGASITFYGTAVIRQFEQMGVFALNPSQAISVSRDKLRTMQILSRHDVGLPPTAYVRDRRDVLGAIERVGGAPVVIKLLEGTQGVGVILAETLRVAQAIIETLQGARQNVLIQKFVSESQGRDIRAFVVGDRVVAAMRRVAQGQEFRSNVHRGGMAQRVTLDPIYERSAILASQILGLRMAGVDMLEASDGPQIMEVNSSPGLEGIERATGVDIAATIIQLVEEQVLFPEVDLRERLTLGKGYGVVEIPVGKGSSLAGRTLSDAHLRERDILVLSIDRGGLVIPNPRGDRQILVGDTLLCYGKRLALKSLMPQGGFRGRPRARRTRTGGSMSSTGRSMRRAPVEPN